MRQSGILMHISSLPSPYGIGKMGDSAYVFADFLADSGIQAWQILPLSPTSFGDSPYQSFSVHAGNPYFIDFERLEKDGLLLRSDYQSILWGDDPRTVNYNKIYANCIPVLRTAFVRFNQNAPRYQKFCQDQADWLPDYALFMALKDANDGKPWDKWEPALAKRKPEAIQQAKETYKEDIAFYSVLQYWFYSQWKELKFYCNQKGISIIGDIPIYVAYDSVDVWTHPELFQLTRSRKPTAVAGCPPDEFSPTGQLWGNPLYNWKHHAETGYAWWIRRLKNAVSLYDTVRIDHFRGFESYYAVPYGSLTAENGKWEKGPGMALFDAVRQEIGYISIIAEDLGFMTPEVQQLRDACGYPGMKVMQFALDGDPANEYLPQNFTTTNCVAYTGTHDNMTLQGWLHDASAGTIHYARQILSCRGAKDIPAAMLRAAWGSVAYLAVAQIQDFLDSGPESRMNTPSTTGGNWSYRIVSGDLTPRLARRIYKMNELYNRLPAKPDKGAPASATERKGRKFDRTRKQSGTDKKQTVPEKKSEEPSKEKE